MLTFAFAVKEQGHSRYWRVECLREGARLCCACTFVLDHIIDQVACHGYNVVTGDPNPNLTLKCSVEYDLDLVTNLSDIVPQE